MQPTRVKGLSTSCFGTKEKIFQSPKSTDLLADLIATRTSDSDIVVDFFADQGA